MSLPPASEATLIAPRVEARVRFAADSARLCATATDTVLVAVSGGADSLALLLLAHNLFGARCHAATVDHGLREEATAEAAWVASVCAGRGIAHAILSASLPSRIGGTANVSTRARALRYGLLAEHAAAIGADVIATAHHADDQVETLAMRLNRGAGVSGLAGVRGRSGKVIRPLLGWRRAELAAVVADCGLVAIDDPTNTDDRFDRARLRKALDGADWIEPTFWAASAAALDDGDAALEWTVERLLPERCRYDDTAVALDPATLPAELVRRLTARCLMHVDPGISIRGSALTALIATLMRGEPATLGAVLARARHGIWRFEPAPARRSG